MADDAPRDRDVPDEPPIGYAAALAELEAILDELDDDELDVDVLGTRVRRAAELLRICRARITAARVEVTQIVAELDAEANGTDTNGTDTNDGAPEGTTVDAIAADDAAPSDR